MNFDDLLGLVLMVVVMVAAAMGSILRSLRRLNQARPDERFRKEPPPPVAVRPPPAERAPEPIRPRKSAKPPEPKRKPSLETRVFRNRRLSTGARLMIASEILSRPKGLRR